MASLPELIGRLRRGTPSALIVTIAGHSTAYLFGDDRVYHFDPLPASLSDVSACPLPMRANVEYSGLIMTRSKLEIEALYSAPQ